MRMREIRCRPRWHTVRRVGCIGAWLASSDASVAAAGGGAARRVGG